MYLDTQLDTKFEMYLDTHKKYLDTQLDTKFEMYLDTKYLDLGLTIITNGILRFLLSFYASVFLLICQDGLPDHVCDFWWSSTLYCLASHMGHV